VIGTESKELPIVTLSVTIPGGHLLMANDTSKIGLPRIFASMMNEDTQKYTAEQLQAELQKLGSSIGVASSLDGITVNVQSLTKNLDKTLAILEERILRNLLRKTLPEFKSKLLKDSSSVNHNLQLLPVMFIPG
jgi:zinc protease